jgi:MoxR-like ATPase
VAYRARPRRIAWSTLNRRAHAWNDLSHLDQCRSREGNIDCDSGWTCWYVPPVPASSRSTLSSDLPFAEALLVDITRLALAGRAEELPKRLRKIVDPPRRTKSAKLSEAGRAALATALAERPEPTSAPSATRFRSATVDRRPTPAPAAAQPVLGESARIALEGVVREHDARELLAASGLRPTRTILLSGPPGVGKSMSIAYLAARLGRPLMHIETSHIIGSLLGESSRMLSSVFADAQASGAVLALDEIDALAKRRDDAHDVGEFKRVVSTLLVELDRWDSEAPLIAATNHLTLLDPALERRFELHVRLRLPGSDERRAIIEAALGNARLQPATLEAVVAVTEGASGADLEVVVRRASRRMVLDEEPLDRALLTGAAPDPEAPRVVRERFAAAARDQAKLTTRQIGDLLGCSHTAARRMALAGADTAIAVRKSR